ncbi:hypothetical protein [Iningainema tapete]|uniref:RDD domain-containing protein n=1 Tax=Iningainema tapete BLCC-T55 TaxID=2748662 RepID=A0A8J6XIU9_9CYAN|nr:hypothetical protein [Iningainema tapete]MBD2775268.1 hypothetical protein [Iningainema tapete BLCC-T55]
MNFKQTASMGILLLGIGLFGMKSADAKNPLVQSPVPTPSVDVTQSSSYTIAQLVEANSPVNGSWKLTYSVDGIVYQSVLLMNGYTGAMRIRYFDPNLRKTQAVDQSLRLKSSPQGLVLLGYNPVYAGTSRRHPTYSADNFLFSIRPDGSPAVFVCDYARRCSAVDVETIR